MSKKTVILGTLIVVLFTFGMLSVPQAKTPDMPPWVTAAMWIPLSDNSGVLWSQEAKTFADGASALHGTLFVKVAGVWQRLYLDPAPVANMPIDMKAL